MNLQILPLAITMMAGPQIMSAIIFITARKPLKLSSMGNEGSYSARFGLMTSYTSRIRSRTRRTR
jgi:small neutral amino acid transporter SnatA (MarC family)